MRFENEKRPVLGVLEVLKNPSRKRSRLCENYLHFSKVGYIFWKNALFYSYIPFYAIVYYVSGVFFRHIVQFSSFHTVWIVCEKGNLVECSVDLKVERLDRSEIFMGES